MPHARDSAEDKVHNRLFPDVLVVGQLQANASCESPIILPYSRRNRQHEPVVFHKLFVESVTDRQSLMVRMSTN